MPRLGLRIQIRYRPMPQHPCVSAGSIVLCVTLAPGHDRVSRLSAVPLWHNSRLSRYERDSAPIRHFSNRPLEHTPDSAAWPVGRCPVSLARYRRHSRPAWAVTGLRPTTARTRAVGFLPCPSISNCIERQKSFRHSPLRARPWRLRHSPRPPVRSLAVLLLAFVVRQLG